jgi:hypothetical protein
MVQWNCQWSECVSVSLHDRMLIRIGKCRAGNYLNFDLAFPSSSIPSNFFPSNVTLYGECVYKVSRGVSLSVLQVMRYVASFDVSFSRRPDVFIGLWCLEHQLPERHLCLSLVRLQGRCGTRKRPQFEGRGVLSCRSNGKSRCGFSVTSTFLTWPQGSSNDTCPSFSDKDGIPYVHRPILSRSIQ